MISEFKVGDIVKSLKGHDKNHVFLVLTIDKNGYLAIIDGRLRKRKNIKKKNPKHLLKIAHDDEILNKANSSIATDTEIYNAIKKYQSNVKE